MPCVKCSNGKWRLGSGKCMYTTLEKCKAAERAYYASRKEETAQEEVEKKKEIKDDYYES
jgi:hypothetical protein